MTTYEIIELTPDNIDLYDLFCQKSKFKTKAYQDKKQWVIENYDNGLRLFILYVDEGRAKLASRGFIEFLPGSINHRGILADNYLVIHCIFVIGRNKGKGYGKELLQKALDQIDEYDGIVMATSTTNWLMSPQLLQQFDFEQVDSWRDHFELYVKYNEKLPVSKRVPPSFEITAPPSDNGFVVYRSVQCPYTTDMSKWIKKYAEDHSISFEERVINHDQPAYHPYGSFYITYNGQLVTYESNKKTFIKEFELLSLQ